MKPGQNISRNTQLELYLQSMGHEHVSDTRGTHTYRDSYIYKLICYIISCIQLLCNRCVLLTVVLLKTCSTQYGVYTKLYLHTHGYTGPSEDFFLETPLVALMALILIKVLYFFFFVITSLRLVYVVIISFPCILCIAFISQSFYISYSMDAICRKAFSLERSTRACTSVIRKMQLTLCGRDILHPLPPVHKLEEYIAMRCTSQEQDYLAMREMRMALSTSLQKLCETLKSINASQSYSSFSANGNLSSRALHTHIDDVFHSLLPLVIHTHYNRFASTTSFEYSTAKAMEEFISTLSASWSVYRVYSALLSYERVLLSLNPSMHHNIALDNTYFTDDDDMNCSSVLGEDPWKLYMNARQELSTLRARCEDTALRVYQAECKLAGVAFSCLNSSNLPNKDTIRNNSVSPERVLELERVVNIAQEALHVYTGRGVSAPYFEENAECCSAESSNGSGFRNWSLPTASELESTLVKLADLVRICSIQHKHALGEDTAALLCVEETQPIPPTDQNEDIPQDLSNRSCPQFPVPSTQEEYSDGADRAAPSHLSLIPQLSEGVIEVITAEVLSDIQIKHMTCDPEYDRNREEYRAISRTVMSELGGHVGVIKAKNSLIERERSLVTAPVPDSSPALPVLKPAEQPHEMHIAPSFNTDRPLSDVVSRANLQCELSSLLGGIHREGDVIGDSSDDDCT